MVSIAFYATWGLSQFAFVAVAAVMAYTGAILIEKIESKTKKKFLLFAVVAILVLMLLYVKLGKLFFDAKSIIVPLGISYYTFSVIGYLADVYWGKEKSEKKFMKFLFFILYFQKYLKDQLKNIGRWLTGFLRDISLIINSFVSDFRLWFTELSKNLLWQTDLLF